MNQKSNINHKPEEIDLAQNSKTDNQLFTNLDKITLEQTFIEQDLPELAYPSVHKSFVPQKAVYITEIDDKFYLLNYALEGEKAKPVPIKSELVKSQLTPAATESSIKNHTSISGSSPFLGRKALLIGMGLGILLIGGATRLFFAPSTANKGAEMTRVSENAAPAQTVTVAEVTTTDINSILDASGTVAAYERIPVMSQAGGLQITEVLADRGDFVNRGQVLARLNNRVLTAEKIQAEGEVAQTKARLDELRAGSRAEEIAQAEAKVANAESAIVQAESNLDLAQERVERNRTLQAEGAISRDSLDEFLNQEQVAKSSLAGAKANLNEAQQALAQSRAGSRPQTIAQAAAELAQARGKLQAIEAQLADTIIVAPASGLIASREASIGQITSNSEMLFSIIQDGRLELRLQVPETLIGKIEPGQQVQIASNSNRDLKLAGKVREIDPLIDDASRQATVKVDLPQGTNLKPGMFLKAAINTDTNQGQAVPIEALLPQSDNLAIAFILQDDNTVKAQTVEMGQILDTERVEVISGLEPGDRIILQGAAYLKDGDRVAISSGEV
ncbi:efflux RND transporter periplasmic adaptor subunit [Pleurocapsales cyanobacterium LEGE 10410]|nr:efflux RND transporter periplasmic adaptor subunit [Pleurocapsales cyanobacterium LEGE 10410]